MIPTTIGNYKIIEELGRGGMAVVYLADDPAFERRVAIKVISDSLAQDNDFLARFNSEAKLIAGLEHIRIAPVYEYGQVGDAPYIVMRYMSNGSVKDELKSQGRLSLERVVSIVTQLSEALDYAHSRNVIHRDLKPGNVLRDEHGNVFLSDFGLARVVRDSTKASITVPAGTPGYMAPEQVLGRIPTARTDVYALGAMTFELLAGRTPIQLENNGALWNPGKPSTILNLADFRPDLPRELQPLFERAMAYEPLERFPTAGDFARELIAIHKRSLNPPQPPVRSKALRQLLAVGVFACIGLFAIVALGLAGARTLLGLVPAKYTPTTGAQPSIISTSTLQVTTIVSSPQPTSVPIATKVSAAVTIPPTVCPKQVLYSAPEPASGGSWLYNCLSASGGNWVGPSEDWAAKNWKRGASESEIVRIVVPTGAATMGLGCDPCSVTKPDGNVVQSKCNTPTSCFGSFDPNIRMDVAPNEIYTVRVFGSDSCPNRQGVTPPCAPQIFIWFNLQGQETAATNSNNCWQTIWSFDAESQTGITTALSKAWPGFVTTRDASTFAEGGASLRIETNKIDHSSWSWMENLDTIEIQDGTYRVLAWIKTSNVAQTHIAIVTKDAAGQDIYVNGSDQLSVVPSDALDGTLDWQFYSSRTFNPLGEWSTSAKTLHIGLNAGWSPDGKTSATWFDDVQLQYCSNSTSVPAEPGPTPYVLGSDNVQPFGTRHISLSQGQLIVGTADRFQGDVNKPNEPPCMAFLIRGPVEMDVTVKFGGWERWANVFDDVTAEQLLASKRSELTQHSTCPTRGINMYRYP